MKEYSIFYYWSHLFDVEANNESQAIENAIEEIKCVGEEHHYPDETSYTAREKE